MLVRQFPGIKRCILLRKNRTINFLCFNSREMIPFPGNIIPILDESIAKRLTGLTS